LTSSLTPEVSLSSTHTRKAKLFFEVQLFTSPSGRRTLANNITKGSEKVWCVLAVGCVGVVGCFFLVGFCVFLGGFVGFFFVCFVAWVLVSLWCLLLFVLVGVFIHIFLWWLLSYLFLCCFVFFFFSLCGFSFFLVDSYP